MYEILEHIKSEREFKMPRNNQLLKTVLIFLLIFAAYCDSQINGNKDNMDQERRRNDVGSAFFALRSCHQVMHSDGGEFFSPEYLCSNPPLWCNWTIHVSPGKRVHLSLEDMTPADTCHLKQDQIHVDEPAGYYGGHKVLQKCWHEARYTSASNILFVVLLIGGYPDAPYRGFYGRYQAFGPPVAYSPVHDDVPEQEGALLGEPTSLEEHVAGGSDAHLTPAVDSEAMGRRIRPPPAHDDGHVSDDYEQPLDTSVELPWDEDMDRAVPEKEGHQTRPIKTDLYNTSHFPAYSAEWNFRSGREASQAQSEAPPSPNPTSVPQERLASHVASTAPPSVESTAPSGDTVAVLRKSSGPHVPGVVSDAEDTLSHPRVVEPMPYHTENGHMRNHTEFPHLPGDHLFEVAVELNFSQNPEGQWEDVARSLLVSLKALIIEQLEPLHIPKSLSSKRIKRLNTGVLYILWLHIGGKSGGPQTHSTFQSVHSVLQTMIETAIFRGDGSWKAAIISVSTADVNECGTQLVLCDINADCVNRYGSYSCHCLPGFQDMSRLGSGGTLCVDVKTSGCRSGPSAELIKGVYVVFFLLSSLILVLLVTLAVMYRVHHRGAFLVRCNSDSLGSGPHFKDNGSVKGDSAVCPPPPPIRRPKEGWSHPKECCPAVDLPLLRFSPVRPLDGYIEPQEMGQM